MHAGLSVCPQLLNRSLHVAAPWCVCGVPGWRSSWGLGRQRTERGRSVQSVSLGGWCQEPSPLPPPLGSTSVPSQTHS